MYLDFIILNETNLNFPLTIVCTLPLFLSFPLTLSFSFLFLFLCSLILLSFLSAVLAAVFATFNFFTFMKESGLMKAGMLLLPQLTSIYTTLKKNDLNI